MSLTGKLILGFLFALVLQVAQIAIGNMFTARLQEVSALIAGTLAANVAVQNGLDVNQQLHAHIARDGVDGVDVSVLRVYLEELELQIATVARKAPTDATRHVPQLTPVLARVQNQFAQTTECIGDGNDEEAVAETLAFLDDAAQDLDQELHRAQVELRLLAERGMQREQDVRDLPLRASLAIAVVGVAIMAAFVTWFSRQLVIPIQRAWSELEGRVVERTRELATTVERLECEIGERRRAEAQKDEMHRQLVDASRRAGMAELANGVLHNVGNVLNSVNVSADVLRQRLRDSRIDGLSRVADLLRGHGKDLGEFLANSPQGKALPGYLQQLADHLRGEQDVLLGEAGELLARIDHMKEIVDRQQDHARCSGVAVATSARNLLQEALDMHRLPLQQDHVAVDVEVAGDDEGEFDRARVLQILMNFIGNARQAIRETGRGEGRIAVHIGRDGDNVRYRVRDDGVGIASDDLERIFRHGFTTRREGHGFGLHHSANAAAEMSGRLWAESDGMGHGATFVFELPVRRKAEVKA
ncbi:MAG: hypothetical protein IPK26_13765 [Planctomycetes bacterium]|nr:hypothetical protein [Planctomycetota bacterium]